MATPPANLVIGASGAIGSAVAAALAATANPLITISRQPTLALPLTGSHRHLQCDYSAEAIHRCAANLDQGELGRVVICNGRLHDQNIWPEKRLEDLNTEAMQALFTSNTMVPMQWLQALLPAVKSEQPCVIAALSARIGSISDNGLGGWYSYRMSKAALNMGLQTAAIEYGRRAKNVRLLAFHPGTTDSALSAPFQASVPPEKLFSPDVVARQLLNAMNAATTRPPGQAHFVDWQGKPIPW